jgi:hypothetical protein
MDKSKNGSRLLAVAFVVVFAAIFLLTALTVRRAELNQDEGWYLYGAGLIHDGLRPYIDFATTQGPVMQYTYAMFWGVIEKWGILGGRIITSVFGLLAAVLAVSAAWRIIEPGRKALGSLAVLCLAGLNTYQIFFFSTVKTYALAAVWICASFLLLTFTGKGRHAYAFFSGVLLMMAAGTRMSAGIMIPAVVLGLLLEAKWSGMLKKDFRWLAYGAGASVCMAVLFGPFLMKAPEAVRFAMFDYHAGRSAGNVQAVLAYKAGFAVRAVRAYYPAILALLGVGAYQWFCGTGATAEQRDGGMSRSRFSAMVLVSVLLVTLLHIAAPFPYDDYQAMIFPVFCAGVVTAGAGLLPAGRNGRPAVILLLGALLFAGASPVMEQMFAGKRDRIWWPMRSETSLQKLDRAAGIVAAHAGRNDVILTQDLYIAVEGGMKVPRGLELGPFSFFPGWSRAKAEKLHVVNEEMMREILSSAEAGVAALSEYSLAIKAPEISPYEKRGDLVSALESRFVAAEKIADFGQAETELTIYVRKDP